MLGRDVEVGVITVCDNHDVVADRDFKEIVLTSDVSRVIRHIETVPDAQGNSSNEECYERAIHRLREWKWDPKATKVVVITGDSVPHPVTHRKNPERLDCRAEARALVKEQGVKIYPIFALTFYHDARPFWEGLAVDGNGVMLRLDQFEHITPLLLGIAAREGGTFAEWEKQYVQSVPAISYAVQRSLDALAGRKVRTFTSRNKGMGVADEGRFQVFTIDAKVPASQFFCDAGVIDTTKDYGKCKGRLFYAHEVRASEDLRPTHEVIVQDDRSGEMVFGDDARAFIGIPYGTKGRRLERNFRKDDGYTIWIQSKSVGNSRHLEAGQRVMIDMNPTAGFRMASV